MMNENVYKWIAVAETAFMIGVVFGAAVSGTGANATYAGLDTDVNGHPDGYYGLGVVTSGIVDMTHIDDANGVNYTSAWDGAFRSLFVEFSFPTFGTDVIGLLWRCHLTGPVGPYIANAFGIYWVANDTRFPIASISGGCDNALQQRTTDFSMSGAYVYLQYASNVDTAMSVMVTYLAVNASTIGSGSGSVPVPMLWFFAVVFLIAAPAVILILLAWRRHGRGR
jgi:hypothetical protein